MNLDVDVWVHLNCALWSLEVYETLNGALMNVDVAVKRGTVTVGLAVLSLLLLSGTPTDFACVKLV